MLTVFERIPDLFVAQYDGQFRAWAENFQRVGRVAAFRLKQPVEPLPMARDQRRVVGVRLQADLDMSVPGKPRMVIRPQTEADEEAIKRHVFDLAPRVLS